MSLVLGTAFPWGKSGEIWANLVRERTQGRINIKLYPGVSLLQGDQTREFSALAPGRDRPRRGIDHQLVAAGAPRSTCSPCLS